MTSQLFNNEIYVTCVCIQWFLALLHIYVVWREWRFIRTVKVRPSPVKKYMDEETFKLLKSINQSLLLLEMINESFVLILRIVFHQEFAHISVWNYSIHLTGTTNEVVITSVFIALTTAKEFLLMTPILLFTLMTFKQKDLVTSILIIIVQFIVLLVVQIITLNLLVLICKSMAHVSKNTLIYWSIAFVLGLTIVRELAVSIAFEGMFPPLDDPAILSELRPVTEDMHFPEDHFYVLQMQRATDLPNAFTVGSFLVSNYRIVISDNILGENKELNDCCSLKEVCAIILHELGHVHLKHLMYTALLEMAIMLSTMILFILLYQDVVFEAFGFQTIRPIIVGLFIRVDLLAGFNAICALAYMLHVRRGEYQADLFSLKYSGKHLRNALIKLHLIQPTDLQTHDPLYSIWNLDHPCLMERIKNMHEHGLQNGTSNSQTAQ